MSRKYLSKTSAFIIMLSFCISLQQGAFAASQSCEEDIEGFLEECDRVCNTYTNKGSTPKAKDCRTRCGKLHTWMEENLCE